MVEEVLADQASGEPAWVVRERVGAWDHAAEVAGLVAFAYQ